MMFSGYAELQFNTKYRVCVDLEVDGNQYEIDYYSVYQITQ